MDSRVDQSIDAQEASWLGILILTLTVLSPYDSGRRKRAQEAVPIRTIRYGISVFASMLIRRCFPCESSREETTLGVRDLIAAGKPQIGTSLFARHRSFGICLADFRPLEGVTRADHLVGLIRGG